MTKGRAVRYLSPPTSTSLPSQVANLGAALNFLAALVEAGGGGGTTLVETVVDDQTVTINPASVLSLTFNQPLDSPTLVALLLTVRQDNGGGIAYPGAGFQLPLSVVCRRQSDAGQIGISKNLAKSQGVQQSQTAFFIDTSPPDGETGYDVTLTNTLSSQDLQMRRLSAVVI